VPVPFAHVENAVDTTLYRELSGILRRVELAREIKPLAGGCAPGREQEKRRRVVFDCHADQ
jgi:hypothetical protein